MTKAGRHTKYHPKSTIELSEFYIKNYADEYGHFIPSVMGLAETLEVTPKTLYNWAEHKDRTAFLHILEKLNNLQHRLLVENGLKGEFNSTITKLVLGKHGYTDKTENENTTKLEVQGDVTFVGKEA